MSTLSSSISIMFDASIFFLADRVFTMDLFRAFQQDMSEQTMGSGECPPSLEDVCREFVRKFITDSDDEASKRAIAESAELQELISLLPENECKAPLPSKDLALLEQRLTSMKVRDMCGATQIARKSAMSESSASSREILPTVDDVFNNYRIEWSGGFSSEVEVSARLQALELLLRHSLSLPSTSRALKPLNDILTSRVIQNDIRSLREVRALKIQGAMFPSVCWCLEMMSLRKLLLKWGSTAAATCRTACAVGSAISKYFDSKYHRSLEEALDTELARLNTDTSSVQGDILMERGYQIETLLLRAVQHTPMAFPEKTLPYLRRVVGGEIPKPEGIPSASVTTTSLEDTQKSLAVVSGSKRSRDEEAKAVEADDEDDEDGLSVCQIAARQAMSTPQKNTRTKNGGDLLNGPGVRAPVPSTNVVECDDNDVLQWVSTKHLPSERNPVVALPAPILQQVGLSTPSHPHPCHSKYHAKYSSADKHASAACQFCSLCHMMEFLFNGCVRDCSWKHIPTAKKIAMHLKGFPTVQALAKRRLQEITIPGSTRLPPMELPE